MKCPQLSLQSQIIRPVTNVTCVVGMSALAQFCQKDLKASGRWETVVFQVGLWLFKVGDANDLVLTESNVRAGKLRPGVLMVTQERSRACSSPVESRHSSSGQALALEQGGRGNGSLYFGGTK